MKKLRIGILDLVTKSPGPSLYGRVMNANLGEYHVPVNADVPAMEALTVEEHDPYVNALGIKGVGEIGITGSAGAVANAIWHATGVRTRRFPIRIGDLMTAC